MFAKAANNLTKSLIDNDVINRSDFELYRFGFEVGFAIMANILTTLVIGILFRMPLESLMFLAAFIPLRSYVGGFHTSNHLRCYWLSIPAVIAVLFSVRYVASIYSPIYLILIGGICVIIMFILVPVQDANRPLDSLEIRVYGRRAKIVIGIEFSAMVILALAGFRTISAIIFCTLLLSCIAVCAGAIKNYIKPIKALH